MKQTVTAEHLSAYRLHPKYRGEDLNEEQLSTVHEYMTVRSADFGIALIEFEAKAVPFPKFYFGDLSRTMNSITWWQGLRSYKVPSAFVNFAVRLMS